ncbi:MAG: enoyl-CoA hydratase-related protein [Gammaproteobacteria bacterium]
MASLECNELPVLLSIQNSVAWVTFNRAEQGNRLDVALVRSLTEMIEALNENECIRLIVLQAQGKHFCLGADMSHMLAQKNASFHENVDDAMMLVRLFETLADSVVPILAVVHGKVYGGGVGLVACADMVICDDAAEFCLSELKLGLMPAVISPYVVNAMGVRQAKRWMMTALPFSAEIALQSGLVHTLFNVKTHQALLSDTIHAMLQCAPVAMRRLKSLLSHFEFTLPPEDRAQLLASMRIQPEAQEGLSAFLEKRKPSWCEEKS